MTSNKLTLLCLIDGEKRSESFHVDLETNKCITVGHLKEEINTKAGLAVVNPRKLTLWSVPKDELPKELSAQVVLDNIIGVSKELNPEDDLITAFEGELPTNFRIIVQVPQKGYTEAEFVRIILPAILSERDQLPSSDTRRRYAVSLTSVITWSEFITNVNGANFDNIDRRYSSPTFYPNRMYFGEETIRPIFAMDAGSVGCLNPQTETRYMGPLPVGEPDLMCRLRSTQRNLFPIEVKRPRVLSVAENTTLPDAYRAQTQASFGPRNSLDQIVGYMWCNGFRYGVLTSYNQTWFLKLSDPKERRVQVSPTIGFNQTSPTLLQCYLWFIREVERDKRAKTKAPKQQAIDDARQPGSDNSDYKPTKLLKGGGPFKEWRSSMNPLSSKKTSNRHDKERQVTVPRFENMTFIGHGDVAVFSATWQGQDIFVKKCDIWKNRQGVEVIKHEVNMYYRLESLQGIYIPRMLIAGISDGIDMVLATENAGQSINDYTLNLLESQKIRMALSEIHRLGVCHGDIRAQNITVRQVGQESQVMFIDFGRSMTTDDREMLRQEERELEDLLCTRTLTSENAD
ncbi:hypothetical protein FBU30_009961 [Linnemannia zychae]|nr:hypothetical protein FBU30_009961 [Linnemannia zychae]